MSLYIQAIVNGLLVGGVYSLMALGLSLIFGVMRVINFAHGDMMVWGMYLTYGLFVSLGLDPYLSIPVTGACIFLVGVAMQCGLVNRIVTAPHEMQILLMLGVALVLENSALMVFGPDPRRVTTSYGLDTFWLGPIVFDVPRVITFGVALALALGLYLFLQRTDLGRMIRAASDNRTGALLVGTDILKVFALAFGIGAACVGAAGSLMTPFLPFQPSTGLFFTITSFNIVIIGGMGSLVGAFVGGLLVGVSEALGAVILVPSLKEIVSFVVLVLILLYRPQGLLGEQPMIRRLGVGAAVGIGLIVLPFLVPSTWQNLLITTFYYAFLGQAWNILGGYAGQLSLGHAAFFAVGAYTSAVLAIHLGISPWIGMLAGAALAALLSLGVGYLGFRFGLRGFYFILLTLAAAEICRLIALHLPILGGYTGLFIDFTPNPWQFQFRGKIPYYFVALAFLAVATAITWALERSKLGAYLVAIREDEDASEALGVNTFRYKMLAYALSAALTALGGTFYAYFEYYLQPNTVLNINHSVDIMIRPIVGGSGTVLGPILGSFLLELLGEFSRTYFAAGTAGLSVVIYGLLLIVVVLFLPRGVYPTLLHWLKRGWRRAA